MRDPNDHWLPVFNRPKPLLRPEFCTFLQEFGVDGGGRGRNLVGHTLMANKRKISTAALFSLLAVCAFAQTATTNPVGFVKLAELASSDTIVSSPLERAAEFHGTVSSISGDTIVVNGAPGWTANQFLYAAGSQPKTFFVRFTSGARAGAYFTVLGNTASALSVDTNGDSLATVAAGDQLQVVPYWTIGTVFPAADVGVSYEASTSTVLRKTELLFPSLNAVGTNPSASATYFFYNSAWRKVGSPVGTSFNDTVILPDAYFIVRNKAFTGSLTYVGSVLSSQIQIGLNARSGTKQDNVVALTRPVDVSLNDSGLVSSGAFQASTSTVLRKDELFVFDNSVAGTNKSASATYFYYNNGWRKVGQPVGNDYGTDVVFKAGTGVVIRKAASTTGDTTVDWDNSPTY